jgi:4-hydroxybenzoate polyprenyltransferase
VSWLAARNLNQNSWLKKTNFRVFQFFNFLTSSSLYLALNSALVVFLGFVLYKTAISIPIMIAAFLATFSVYALNKATDKTEDAINRPTIASKNPRYYLIPSLAALILSLTIGLLDGPLADLILIAPLLVGLFYSVRFSKRVPRLKEVVGVKSILVAFSWAFTGSLLPALMAPVDHELVLLVFVYIFFSLLVNTVLFDVLDLKGDRVSGVRTIPFVLGSRRTKVFLILMNSCLVIWLVYSVSRGLFLSCMPALAFGVLYGYVMIGHFAGRHIRRLRAELLVDGEWIPLVAILRLFLR